MNSVTISGTVKKAYTNALAVWINTSYTNRTTQEVTTQGFFAKVEYEGFTGDAGDVVVITGRLHEAFLAENGQKCQRINARSVEVLHVPMLQMKNEDGSEKEIRVDPQINNVCIAGFLGKDPYQAEGSTLCRVSLGIEYDQNVTIWPSVSFINGQATAVKAHMHKGHQLIVEGALETPYAWTSNDNATNGIDTQVRGFRAEFGRAPGGAPSGASQSTVNQEPVDPDDIPF